MEKINEDEFYEYWKRYWDVMNSLPIEVRRNFEWLMVNDELMKRRRRICDTLEKSRKA